MGLGVGGVGGVVGVGVGVGRGIAEYAVVGCVVEGVSGALLEVDGLQVRGWVEVL